VFFDYGELKNAPVLARTIVEAREVQPDHRWNKARSFGKTFTRQSRQNTCSNLIKPSELKANQKWMS
jgi:16S rRNA (cytosine1402-N4)-methyltransferase